MIIKPTQEKRTCHEVKIHPKEVEHPAQVYIQDEAKMQSNMDEIYYERNSYNQAMRCPYHKRNTSQRVKLGHKVPCMCVAWNMNSLF